MFEQPLCAIVRVNICARVKNPKHWHAAIYHCWDTRKYFVILVRMGGAVFCGRCSLSEASRPEIPAKDKEELQRRPEPQGRRVSTDSPSLFAAAVALARQADPKFPQRIRKNYKEGPSHREEGYAPAHLHCLWSQPGPTERPALRAVRVPASWTQRPHLPVLLLLFLPPFLRPHPALPSPSLRPEGGGGRQAGLRTPVAGVGRLALGAGALPHRALSGLQRVGGRVPRALQGKVWSGLGLGVTPLGFRVERSWGLAARL